MDPIGKTIARIEEAPTDPEYLYKKHDVLLIHFTDGTALELTASSQEEADISAGDVIDQQAVRVYQRAAQGRREQERLMRLQREEYARVSPEERARRRAARRAKMSPWALALEDEMVRATKIMLADMNRSAYGS